MHMYFCSAGYSFNILVQHCLLSWFVFFLFLFLDFTFRWFKLFSLSGTVSILIEVTFLSDLITSSEFCFAWFSLFLFVSVVNFLFLSGILLLIHYKSFTSPFVFLLHFHTFLLVFLFLQSSSETCSSVVFSHLKWNHRWQYPHCTLVLTYLSHMSLMTF